MVVKSFNHCSDAEMELQEVDAFNLFIISNGGDQCQDDHCQLDEEIAKESSTRYTKSEVTSSLLVIFGASANNKR